MYFQFFFKHIEDTSWKHDCSNQLVKDKNKKGDEASCKLQNAI